jgi:hypothetical protein
MTAKEATGAVWNAEFANDLLLRGKAHSITQLSERREKKSRLKPQQLVRLVRPDCTSFFAFAQ